jgi:flagellar basal body-associated protein FliL
MGSSFSSQTSRFTSSEKFKQNEKLTKQSHGNITLIYLLIIILVFIVIIWGILIYTGSSSSIKNDNSVEALSSSAHKYNIGTGQFNGIDFRTVFNSTVHRDQPMNA